MKKTRPLDLSRINLERFHASYQKRDSGCIANEIRAEVLRKRELNMPDDKVCFHDIAVILDRIAARLEYMSAARGEL